MANFHYIAARPNGESRKGILRAQMDLYRTYNVLLYDQYPLQLGLLKALMYRRDIEFFLHEVIFPMETLSSIERNKILEVRDLYSEVTASYQKWAYISGISFALYSIFNLKHDWVYKYHIKYMPSVPRAEVWRRLGKGLTWGVLAYTSGKWLVPLCRALYFSDMLANLQIGDQFELGYWTKSFVSKLVPIENSP